MSFWSRLFGSDKTVDNILDKDKGLLAQIGGWVGNLKLTQEEVMEFNGKTIVAVQEFVKATLGENSARSKARRSIAILWIKAELGVMLMACICAPWDVELAEFYFKLASSGVMFGGTTAIIIFFFGSYGLVRHNESKKVDND